jgi:hypothetical protein
MFGLLGFLPNSLLLSTFLLRLSNRFLFAIALHIVQALLL